uniref:CHLM n=2 Tax=Arundo donax TaxID=35708 RepID=A0A0A9G7B2_ARUDO
MRNGDPVGCAASASCACRCASDTMVAEMSEASTSAPSAASGIARDPVPHPASQTVAPASGSGESRSMASVAATVCAWPSRMSSCTRFTPSVADP